MRSSFLPLLFCLAVASVNPASSAAAEPVTLLIAAAASLRPVFENELMPRYEKTHPGVTLQGTFDASGKLQTQIENGLAADLFISASPKQMQALSAKQFIRLESVFDLLENRIVLILPAASRLNLASFEDLAKVKGVVALGDPASVPAGQYAREALTSLGIWDQVAARASFGTNVTEVLHWVAEGSAEAGIVYQTDAAREPRVNAVAEAPAGSLRNPVIYPAGILSGGRHLPEAEAFAKFLRSPEAAALFRQYGFTPCD